MKNINKSEKPITFNAIDRLCIIDESGRQIVEKTTDWICNICDFSKHDVYIFATDHYPFGIDVPFTLVLSKNHAYMYSTDWELIDSVSCEIDEAATNEEVLNVEKFEINEALLRNLEKPFKSEDEALRWVVDHYKHDTTGDGTMYDIEDGQSFKDFVYFVLVMEDCLHFTAQNTKYYEDDCYECYCYNCDHSNECTKCPYVGNDIKDESYLQLFYFGGMDSTTFGEDIMVVK